MLEQADALLGRVVGEYRLTQVIGADSMSFFFRGQRVDDPTAHVAVKVLQPPPTASPEEQVAFSARSARELRAASRLRHAHIVPILRCGEVEGRPYLAQPLLPGGTLAARLASQREPLPLEEAERYVRQLASALDYAHEHGVVHRNVEPQNILLDAQGRAVLIDFGIAGHFASEVDAGEKPSAGDFATVAIARANPAAPRYMAPEQIRGEPVGPAADIYALGVVLYLLVTGRVPFTADTPFAVALQQVRDTPLDPHLVRLELPVPASAAILRALAKRPEDRFSSAGALAKALAAGLEGRWTEGLSPQTTQPDPEVTLVDPRAVTLSSHSPLSLPPVSVSPTSSAAARPPLWPGVLGTLGGNGPRPLDARSARSPNVRDVALLALGCLALFALGWGGATLIPALRASAHRLTTLPAPAAHSASRALSAPSITIGVQDDSVYAVRTSGNTLLWSFPTDGRALASPPVVNDIVYVATDNGHLYALRAADGKPIWNTRVADVRVAGSPVIVTEVVYAATDDGHVYALRAVDGSVLWNTRVAGDHVAGSPTFASHIVYVVTDDGHVYALRAGDGTVLWNTYVHVDGNVSGPVTVSDGTIAIQTQNGNTYTLRASDGAQLAS